jgi:hypothetical protein
MYEDLERIGEEQLQSLQIFVWESWETSTWLADALL